MQFRSLLPPLGGLVLACPTAAQDNLLVLLADDLGVEIVGAYGEGPEPARTPVIDSLAAGGVLFRNAWSNPVCSPTRATILTGRHSFRTGVGVLVGKQGYALPLEEWLLPELLDWNEGLGYAHAAFGKWHLGNPSVGGASAPNLAGWSHFAGTEENFRAPLGQSYYSWPKIVDGVVSTSTVYATSDNVDDVLAWVAATPEPWLCYVAFNAPHNPFHAPPFHLHGRSLPKLEPRERPRPFYIAMVEALDTEIGRLLDGLGEQRARTNVVFAGDNGTPNEAARAPFVAEHLKISPYEGGINVPLIVAGPAVVDPGREVAGLVQTTDLFLTALELCGVDPSSGLPPGLVHDSVSLLPYLVDPGQAPLREHVFAEMFRPNATLHDSPERDVQWYMLRDERYKLIRRGVAEVEWELYDLESDPFELENLALEPMSSEVQDHFLGLVLALEQILASGG